MNSSLSGSARNFFDRAAAARHFFNSATTALIVSMMLTLAPAAVAAEPTTKPDAAESADAIAARSMALAEAARKAVSNHEAVIALSKVAAEAGAANAAKRAADAPAHKAWQAKRGAGRAAANAAAAQKGADRAAARVEAARKALEKAKASGDAAAVTKANAALTRASEAARKAAARAAEAKGGADAAAAKAAKAQKAAQDPAVQAAAKAAADKVAAIAPRWRAAAEAARLVLVPKKEFVHPPLKVMAKYTNINEYPVMAWCFHGRGCPGYNVEFVKQAEMAGFNTLIDVQLMLPHAAKFDRMMVVVPAFKFSPKRLDGTIFHRYPGHPRLIGVIMDDNCRNLRASMPGGTYVAKKYPHVVAYVSENPTPQHQKNTPMRVLGTQNYEMWRGRGVIGYCERLNFDRWFGNRHNMSFWPIFAAPIGHTAYRFQVYAALAYGAQGIICFAYAPGDRWPQWKYPRGNLARMARPVHMYARKVAGKHIWGTRSLGVFHSQKDRVPRGDGKAGITKIVQAMDANLLAGFLVPEKDFIGWKDVRAPDYAMIVDKRAHRNWSGDKPRDVKVSFHPSVFYAEVLPMELVNGPIKIRPIEPGICVPLHLNTGDGLLLRLNPDLKDALGPLAEPYVAVCRQMTDLAFRTRLTAARAAAEAAKTKAEEAQKAAAAKEAEAAKKNPKGKRKKRGKPKEIDTVIIPDVKSLAGGEFKVRLAEIVKGVKELQPKAKTGQARDTVARLRPAVEYVKTLDPAAKPEPQPEVKAAGAKK